MQGATPDMAERDAKRSHPSYGYRFTPDTCREAREGRRTVRGPLVCGVSIELVVEDGTDRAVGEGADLDGARGGGFQTRDAERARQPQDAEAGSKALLGVGPLLQDEIAEGGGGWTDEGGRR